MPLMLGNFGHNDTRDLLDEENPPINHHSASQLANSQKGMIRVVSLNK